LTGCFANQSTVFRTDTIEEPELAITDGGQRAISSTMGPDNRLIVCKERYPDVFWGLATSSGLSIKIAEKGEGQAAIATGQEVGFAGLRTQLRESQARTLDALCDFYAGGAIDGGEVEILLRRFQNHVLAALAIEQLTGYARPTVVTLSASADAGVGAGLAEAQKALSEAEALLSEKKTALAPLQQALDSEEAKLKKLQEENTTKAAAAQQAIAKQSGVVVAAKGKVTAAEQSKDEAAITAAKNELASAEKALEKLKSDEAKRATDVQKAIAAQQAKVNDAKKKLETPTQQVQEQEAKVKTLTAQRDAVSRAVTASTTSKESGISQPVQIVLSDKATQHVATAVTHILDTAFSQHYTAEQCQNFLFSEDFNVASTNDPRTVICIDYFKTIRESVKKLNEAKAEAIKSYYKSVAEGTRPAAASAPTDIVVPFSVSPDVFSSSISPGSKFFELQNF